MNLIRKSKYPSNWFYSRHLHANCDNRQYLFLEFFLLVCHLYIEKVKMDMLWDNIVSLHNTLSQVFHTKEKEPFEIVLCVLFLFILFKKNRDTKLVDKKIIHWVEEIYVFPAGASFQLNSYLHYLLLIFYILWKKKYFF